MFALTPGDVVMLSAFFTTLTASVTTLMSLSPIIAKGLESVRSIGEVPQAPDLEHNSGKAEVASVARRLDFQDVSFAYDTGRIAEIGSHDELLRSGGVYSGLQTA